MGLATGLLFGSTLLNIYGQQQENKANRKAARQNAEFYRLQKLQIEKATARKKQIFKKESEMFLGDQLSSYVRAGVDISGSALLNLAQTKREQGQELFAIEQEGQLNSQLAGIRASQSDAQAKYLGSDSLKFLQIGGGLLGAGARHMSMRNPSPSQGAQNTQQSILRAG